MPLRPEEYDSSWADSLLTPEEWRHVLELQDGGSEAQGWRHDRLSDISEDTSIAFTLRVLGLLTDLKSLILQAHLSEAQELLNREWADMEVYLDSHFHYGGLERDALRQILAAVEARIERDRRMLE